MAKHNNLRIELNLQGLNELMKSEEMQQHLQEAGEQLAAAAGPEYGARTHVADYTAICNVYPDSREAAQQNYSENTLLKAIGSVGLPTSKRG